MLTLKHLIKTCLCCAVATSAMLASARTGLCNQTEEDEVPVTINQNSGISDLLRSRATSFDIFYQGGNLNFSFYEDLGDVSVFVQNTDTGQSWSGLLDSSAVFVEMNISAISPAGEYSVELVDGNGIEYSGHFELL